MGKKFRKLEHRVEAEYEKKGYSKSRAEYIGRATAGEVYREKKAEGHGCTRCSSCHGDAHGMHFCKNCGQPCVK